MEKFLLQCAKYIYTKHSHELKDLCLIFPNRRSGVFFSKYLQNTITSSVIAPEITTINEFISSYSNLHTGDKLQLISLLYDVFKKHTKTTETFDEFYFWGEILLADFNDVDRYLVNAKDLFTNISDLKEIESIFDYLTTEQKKALEQFWGAMMVTDKKAFQEKYTTIWDKLYPVYADFKRHLQQNNLAYPGMIDREVTESLEENNFQFECKQYYVIGLNALNTCEKKFFKHLQQQGKVQFLWDFDLAYLNDLKNEAGHFLRDNLKAFPPPSSFVLDTELFSTRKKIKLLAVSSVYGQAQQIPSFLNETKADYQKEFDNTAVILADETLLFSTLGAIPEEIGSINVTMGYPVRNSVVYGFLMLLVALLKNKQKGKDGFSAYYRYATDILNHQLMANTAPEKNKAFVQELKLRNQVTVKLAKINFTPFHKQLFSLPQNIKDYSLYFLRVLELFHQQLKEMDTHNNMLLELVYSIYKAIEKLNAVVLDVLQNQNREISEAVYFRLFSQYLGQVSVAFEGEPLSGLQVMGILETRCLDFKNLIILGFNENKWPRKFTAPSFIPFNIRKGFGLPGIDEQDAMYGYYFYRLMQRAKNITATYSVVKEGIGTGELSRYGHQLRYDSVHKPEMLNLNFVFANDPEKGISIDSSKAIVQKLLDDNSEEHPLSPSAINVYLHCKLRFYFRYVLRLPEPEELKEEIDGVIFGNIFHDTLEELYKPFIGKVVTKTDVEALLKDKVLLENETARQIAIHYLKKKLPLKENIKLEGKTLLIFENAITYLKQLLKIDKSIAPFSIISLEEKYKRTINVKLASGNQSICIGGKIDRVDQVNGQVRVLDYKTGNVDSLAFTEVEDLFDATAKKQKKEILQALIYSWGLSKSIKTDAIQPVIYSLRSLFSRNFSPNIQQKRQNVLFDDVQEDFELNLKQLLAEMYSENTVFKQTEHLEKCKYCAYRSICRRF